jgi:ABC-type antimicrobial peptide transport system permease subunit
LNINNSDIVRTYDYAFKTAKDYQDDYISVYFSILDSIKPFQDYMFQKHKLKIEMTQIDAKENFNFMSKLTKITLFILILFCVFSISLFVYNLFTNHLEKIKKNIGTFKAFGLENSVLIRVYTAISFILVSASILIGFGAASLFGYFGGVRVILHIFGVNLESGYLYFDLNTAWSYITILLLILVSTGIVWFKLKQMVKNTPGDLIYERK